MLKQPPLPSDEDMPADDEYYYLNPEFENQYRKIRSVHLLITLGLILFVGYVSVRLVASNAWYGWLLIPMWVGGLAWSIWLMLGKSWDLSKWYELP